MQYNLTICSKTTGGTEILPIEVLDGQSVDTVAQHVAAAHGASVVSYAKVEAPMCHRKALRECLGFVEAWQGHLSDCGKEAAAKTVGNTLEKARASYAQTCNPIRTKHVELLIKQHGDDLWGESKIYPVRDWKTEVDNGDTRLGYWEWLSVKLEEAELPA